MKWRRSISTQEVSIQDGNSELLGNLTLPSFASGLVIFAHGSDSSRFSPRNLMVAQVLQQAGLGTLLFDLLTPQEAGERANIFDIPLLAGRLLAATRWCLEMRAGLAGLPLGYFGASTGAAAALWACAQSKPGRVSAVVSRGGRPDLAGPKLSQVTAPTLLIVGGRDEEVLELNRQALKELASAELSVIPEATHLFEEAGALEQVAEESQVWFSRHFEVKALQ